MENMVAEEKVLYEVRNQDRLDYAESSGVVECGEPGDGEVDR